MKLKFVTDLFTELDNHTFDLKRVTFAVLTVNGMIVADYLVFKRSAPFTLREYAESVGILIATAAAAQAAVKHFGAEQPATPTIQSLAAPQG